MPKLQQLSRRRLIDSTFSGDEVGSVLMFILEVLLFEAGSRCAVAVLVECVSCLPNAKSRDLAGTLMRLFAPETFIGTSLIVSRSQSIHVSEKTCIQSSRVVPLQSRSTRPVVFLESLSSRRRLLSSDPQQGPYCHAISNWKGRLPGVMLTVFVGAQSRR